MIAIRDDRGGRGSGNYPFVKLKTAQQPNIQGLHLFASSSWVPVRR